jgi:hypothetical protein
MLNREWIIIIVDLVDVNVLTCFRFLIVNIPNMIISKGGTRPMTNMRL